MLRQILKFYPRRNFSNSAVRKNSEKEVTSPQKQETQTTTVTTPPPSEEHNLGRAVTIDFAPNEYEKFILVYSGKYKSQDEIPQRISYSALDNAKSKVRIKIATYMMLGTVIMFAITIWRGKKHANERRGAGGLAQQTKTLEDAAVK